MAGVELKQQLKLTQTLVLTPQLQLAIKLLQLPRLELIEMIRQELETNPILDDVQGTQEDEEVQEVSLESSSIGEGESDESPNISETEVKGGREIDWERYLENASLSPVIPVYRRAPEEELPGVESAPSKEENLFEYLMWQVRLSGFTRQEEELAALIAGNLDEAGYFREDLSAGEEISQDGPAGVQSESLSDSNAVSEKKDASESQPQEHSEKTLTLADLANQVGMSIEEAEAVLKKMQRLDPVGVASRSLEECLLVQAEVYGFDEIVKKIIKSHLKNLQKRNFSVIAKDLGIDISEVALAVKKISNLEPKPARNFTGDPPQYIVPDVYVEKAGDGYVVRINDEGMPRLRISDSYRKHIKDPRAKEYIKDKLRSAHWLIRSIEQRRRTIVRVTECIVEKQKEFMEKGPAFLKPMVLHDVSRALGLHESTISRVTSGKYVHTPQGIFELKYFFNTGIPTTGPDVASSESVKSRIKEIIANENPADPLSDQQIVSILAKEGILIARRTVAKYRDILGILPSSQRKNRIV